MAKKKTERKTDPRQERIRKGKTLLAAWGIHDATLHPDAGAAEIVEALSPFIGREPACDLVIAERLGQFTDPVVAERLARWEPEAKDKDVKREIRRSLFRLEQKGITVERKVEESAPVSLTTLAPQPEARLGTLDGEGSRIAWLLKPGRGGVTGLLAVINDRRGMLLIDSVFTKRGALMKMLKESSSSGPLAEVPWRYADSLMYQAFRTASPKEGNRRSDYLLSRGEITTDDPAPIPPCPVREAIPPESVSDKDLLDKSAELFKEREYGSWILPEELARPRQQEYVNASHSGLVLSKEAASERAVGIMDAALEDFAGSPWRETYVRRMEEMAWILHLLGREQPARHSLAVALAMENPDPEPLKQVSFLRALIFRAFAPLMAAGKGPGQPDAAGEAAEPETAEGSSLILDPSKAGLSAEPGGPGEPDEDEEAAQGGAPPLIIRP